MIKVLIVEDELLIRMGIQSTIDWKENGFHIIGAVANGADALPLCAQESPDIIISDLEMPKLSGIELMRTLKQQGCNAKFLILTCHTDFTYMQEAIRLGASDYIVKATMEPADLLAAMMKLKETIVSENEHSQRIEKLQRDYFQTRTERQLEQFKGYLLTNVSGAEFAEEQSWDVLGLRRDTLCDLILFEIDHFYSQPVQTEAERKVLARSALQIVETVLPDGALVFSCSVSGLVCVFPMLLSQEKRQEMLAEIRERIEVLLAVSVSAVFTHRRVLLTDLPNIVSLMREKMHQKLLYDAPFTHVLDPREILEQPLGEPFSLRTMMSDVLKLNTGSEEDIRAFLLSLRAYRNGPALVSELLEELHGLWQYCGFCEAEAFQDDWEEELKTCDSLDRLSNWFARWITGLPQMNQLSCTIKNEAIRQALDYLQHCGFINVSLSEAANAVHMSIPYFSHLFKQETGYSFVTYCNERKISRAKWLLATTDLKLGRIARQCGFEDDSYFIRTFKQSVGVTPTKFREQS